MINENRVINYIGGNLNSGPIVYWMQRDQRVNDNWAMLFAQQKAIENNQLLIVIFCLVDTFLGTGLRQYDFMLKGLQEVERNLNKLNIPFKLLFGDPEEAVPSYLDEIKAGVFISDFSPLRIARRWKQKVLDKITIPYYTVDTHNIIPCTIVSNKEEFAAYTIRPKVQTMLPEYLEEFPQIQRQGRSKFNDIKNDWGSYWSSLNVDMNVNEINWIKPGEEEAKKTLKSFLNDKLDKYDSDRNDPTKDAISNLSPYLHFGHISAQRIALDTVEFGKFEDSKKSFLEELIVRRELAENYCFFNRNYDSFDGFRDWAKTTLNTHRSDKRDFIYSMEEFENAVTHDDLWNAAQKEMVHTGKMHGYMRMYWAKKILEWTKSPEDALETAIYLNDKYELDGRDPNGYTGIAWSIGGVHDRAWAERPVFGKIRYMNYNGCRRKFDVDEYIHKNA